MRQKYALYCTLLTIIMLSLSINHLIYIMIFLIVTCFSSFRQLLENPHVHHAVHLADLRREVANDPLGVLRAFRNFKAPKPTDAQGGDKQSSYDDIEEDQRDTSSAGIDNGKTKKGWFGILKDKKASRFVVEEGSHSDK